jgi:asparagine N-glycosylation enzyme membrane subunit Stt3
VLSVFDIQNVILLAATLALFAIEAWAFVDAVSHRPDVFVAADKQTKTMWLVILGVALAAHMLIWHPIHILNIAGAVASIVYLVDVRPAVRALTRH